MAEKALIEDIVFAVVEGGALVPYAEVMKENGTAGYVRIANLTTLLKNDIRIGDYVQLDGLMKITNTLKHLRQIDAHLPWIPVDCPCCGHEMLIEHSRTLVIRCVNDGCLKE